MVIHSFIRRSLGEGGPTTSKWTTKAGAQQDSLKRAFIVWYKRAQRSAKIIEYGEDLEEMSPEEMEPMLSEHIEKWTKELRAEGEAKGRAEGEAKSPCWRS